MKSTGPSFYWEQLIADNPWFSMSSVSHLILLFNVKKCLQIGEQHQMKEKRLFYYTVSYQNKITLYSQERTMDYLSSDLPPPLFLCAIWSGSCRGPAFFKSTSNRGYKIQNCLTSALFMSSKIKIALKIALKLAKNSAKNRLKIVLKIG